MTITVNTPDGGTAQFPDGTPTSAMTSALQAKFGGPSGATAAPAQTDASSKMSGIGRTLENALTLGGGLGLFPCSWHAFAGDPASADRGGAAECACGDSLSG